MTTKDEALKLALRSLRELVPDDSDYAPALQGQRMRQEKAIKATREALNAPLAGQPAQQEAQIVRWNCPCGNKYTFRGFTKAPAQRTWVGLTDWERDDVLDNYFTDEGRAQAIEAKLREKNT